MTDSDLVWNRIIRHQGEVFRQIRGKAFTYEAKGRTIHLHTTNRIISGTAIDKALELVPLANTVPVQELSAPSYIYAILMDDRIRGTDW